MKFTLKVASPQSQQKTCLIIGVYEDKKMTEAAKEIDKASKGLITKLIQEGVFKGESGEILPLIHPANTNFSHILLVGCGKIKTLSPTGFRRMMATTARSLRCTQVSTITCYLTEVEVADKSLAWKARQIAEGTMEGMYCFDEFKSEKRKNHLKEVIISLPDNKQLKACEKELAYATAIADACTFTKNLANLPSNICTPTYIANQAKDLGKKFRAIKVNVLDEKQMKKLGMGALLAVSQGSNEESKLICLQYQGGGKNKAPVALVGKGITFDTGGNSLKSSDSMIGMKYDMCGAATVLGTMRAAAELKLPINIVGVIPSVENMPGGTAYKPDDILKSMSGQTIEVISTDAEGRLILCDALTYCERFKPDVVIDIATLTGAVVVALGTQATGLMSNDDKLAKDLLKAGIESNDRAWQLPLWDEYQDLIRSPFADMVNAGSRMAGSITAGCFLSRFTKKFHWAHLDVAGTAAIMGGVSERMATGRPVPMLTQFLIDRIKK